MRYEGGWDSKMAKLIRETGYNKDVDISLGTVKSAPPNMRINVDGMKYDLDPDDYVMAAHVLPLHVGDRVIVASSHNGQRYYVIGKVAD